MPFWQKLAAVMSFVGPSTSFHSATFLSGMFQSRILPSREPEMKNLSFFGWKPIAVTKSICWKTHRHSFLEICQSRTVLSMEEVRMKKLLDQEISSRSLVCPAHHGVSEAHHTGCSIYCVQSIYCPN